MFTSFNIQETLYFSHSTVWLLHFTAGLFSAPPPKKNKAQSAMIGQLLQV